MPSEPPAPDASPDSAESPEPVETSVPPPGTRRGVPLWARVIIGFVIGATLGVVFGSDPWLFGWSNDDLGPLGMLVIRMLKTLATPLIFVAILDSFLRTAISGRSGMRLLAVCAMNVTFAMALGLVLLNTWQPGAAWAGRLDELGSEIGSLAGSMKKAEGATLDPLQNLSGFIPESIVRPFLDNTVLSIVLIAVLLGAALRRIQHRGEMPDAINTASHVIAVAYEALVTMLMWVAQLVPLAVLLIVAQVVGRAGLQVFSVLWIFLATMLAGLLIHALVYYVLLAWIVARRSPSEYLRGGADAIITGLSCNSSLATMPVTLRCLERMGVRPQAARLSACIGTNFNNDGVMLYEAMAALFLCQAFGLELSFAQQGVVVLASIMAGVGIAGIPEAGLIILPLVLTAAGLPEAAIAVAIPLIVPVDWIIARVRSGVNVMADLVVALVLDRFEANRPAT